MEEESEDESEEESEYESEYESEEESGMWRQLTAVYCILFYGVV